jgi:hypothetical protein
MEIRADYSRYIGEGKTLSRLDLYPSVVAHIDAIILSSMRFTLLIQNRHPELVDRIARPATLPFHRPQNEKVSIDTGFLIYSAPTGRI